MDNKHAYHNNPILDDLDRLETIKLLNLDHNPYDVEFKRLATMSARLLNVPVALISIVLNDRQFFKGAIGLEEPWATTLQTPLSHSFCQHVVKSGEPLIVEDAREHPLVQDNLAISDLNVISYLGVPLTVGSGTRLGSCCVIDSKPRQWTEEDIATVQDLAQLTMTEIAYRQESQRLNDANVELISNQTIIEQSLFRERELSDLKSRFITTISHEFRTPLTTILSTSSFLSMAGDRLHHGERSERLAKVENAARHLNTIVDDLLRFSDLDKHTVQIEFEDFNIEIAVQQVIDSVKSTTQSINRIKLRYMSEKAIVIKTDKQLLCEVVRQIIMNALNHSASESFVECSIEHDNNNAVIKVTDNGIGIPKEDYDKIFLPFHKGKNTINISGTGMGLALAQLAIEKINGKISFVSSLGEGSVFVITLPITPAT